MDKVFVEGAYYWECPKCSEHHFFKIEQSDRIEESEESESILREVLDLEDWQDLPDPIDLDIYQLPDTLECPMCHHTFKADYEDAQEDGELLDELDEEENLEDDWENNNDIDDDYN